MKNIKNHYKIQTNLLASVLSVLLLFAACSAQITKTIDWKTETEILQRISQPRFNNKEYDITKYSAIGDGKTDCTQAIKKAIDECHNNGGGKVIIPDGVFLTGAIHLKSNVNLVITKNAVLKFSTDPSKYLPVVFTRWEGVECMNYSALIYAYEQENIAVTGEGLLDGNASNENWWSWKGLPIFGWKEGKKEQKQDREKLFAMAEKDIPVGQRIFGEGHYLRPSFFQPYKCKNILVDGVTFKDSPMWFLNPVICKNVTIQNVNIEGLGPNNDGCDPESTQDILIRNCSFNTGDDCIAIKSGRNRDGRRVNIPTENVVIKNCKMKEGHGGVVIGSEVAGDVRNVFVSNCEMDSPNLDRAIRVKTNSIRGGVIENLFVKDIKVGQVKESVIHINFFYEEGDKGNFTPVVRNIFIKDMECKKSAYTLWIKAYNRSPVENIHLENCVFNNVEKENILDNVKDIHMKNVSINNKKIEIK